MTHPAIRAAATSLLVLIGLVACAPPKPDFEPNYRELALVVRERVGSCLTNQAFHPPWPTTDWTPERSGYDYAHPVPVNNVSLVSDGTEYHLYFVQGTEVLYLVATAGLSGHRTTYGPLSLSVRCPDTKHSS